MENKCGDCSLVTFVDAGGHFGYWYQCGHYECSSEAHLNDKHTSCGWGCIEVWDEAGWCKNFTPKNKVGK